MDTNKGENPETAPNSGTSNAATVSRRISPPVHEPKIAPTEASITPGSVDTPPAGVEDSSAGVKKRRGGRNSSIINKSPHRQEYLDLMQAGWTSFALERYASYRYGEDIKASTFRQHKAKVLAQKPDWITPDVLTGRSKKQILENGKEARIDVMDIRQKLALLQMQRISLDVATELDLGKLFSSTGREVDLLSRLLNEIKQDQQDFGILPKVADEQRITIDDLPATVAPKHQTLGQALGLGQISPEDLSRVARAVGNVVPITGREPKVG